MSDDVLLGDQEEGFEDDLLGDDLGLGLDLDEEEELDLPIEDSYDDKDDF
jgi:hypothetical protein